MAMQPGPSHVKKSPVGETIGGTLSSTQSGDFKLTLMGYHPKNDGDSRWSHWVFCVFISTKWNNCAIFRVHSP
jgi:hypothetical protein